MKKRAIFLGFSLLLCLALAVVAVANYNQEQNRAEAAAYEAATAQLAHEQEVAALKNEVASQKTLLYKLCAVIRDDVVNNRNSQLTTPTECPTILTDNAKPCAATDGTVEGDCSEFTGQ